MRTKEIDKWVQEGGDLPQELTEDEKAYLKECWGWAFRNDWTTLKGEAHGKHTWWLFGNIWREINFHRGKKHGKYASFYSDEGRWEISHYHLGMKHGVSFEAEGASAEERRFFNIEEYYYGNKIK